MNPQHTKFGMLAFVVLSIAVTSNLMLFQSDHRRGHAPAPAIASAPETQVTPAKALATTVDAGVGVRNAGAAPVDPVRAIQKELTKLGYHPGPVDGVPGTLTRAAVLAFEFDHRLPMTATPSLERLQHITTGVAESDRAAGRGKNAPQPSEQARKLIRTVQDTLHGLGYAVEAADGLLRNDTVRAIRDFEVDHNLKETGRVSGRLIARLSRLAVQGRLAATY